MGKNPPPAPPKPQNLKINRDNYRAGMVNLSEMLEAQTLMQQSRDTLIDMQTRYQVKRVEYAGYGKIWKSGIKWIRFTGF
jgi:hypothetical protein